MFGRCGALSSSAGAALCLPLDFTVVDFLATFFFATGRLVLPFAAGFLAIQLIQRWIRYDLPGQPEQEPHYLLVSESRRSYAS